MALYISVEKKSAQEKISELKKTGNFDFSYRIFEKNNKIWIPIKQKIIGAVKIRGKVQKKAESMADALKGILSKNEMQMLVNSFDIIGDIAIVEIPQALEKKEREIAKALVKVHKIVRVVAKKQGIMEGEYRTRKLKIIFGENRTETLYIENGVRMMLDIAKVYFSPRLSFERRRIAFQVKEGEKILALFAGVGPFPLAIAQKKKCKIIAIELNPIAVKYLKKNTELNKLSDIHAICGDVRKIVPCDYPNYADRILMPLPKGAEEFLDIAYKGAKNNAIVHFYTFVNAKNPFGEAEEKIFSKLGREKVEIIARRIVRPFSPAFVQAVIDFKVKKLKKLHYD